jgi:hypothetical protein
MKKLLTFVLLLMLMACEKNEPNIVTPEFEYRVTSIEQVKLTIGIPDATITSNEYTKFIYNCEFIEVFGKFERIESSQRCFVVIFYDGVTIDWHYSYFNEEEIFVLMKNNPPI